MSMRRIVGSIVAAGLLAGAVFFAIGCYLMDRRFREWIDARPVTLAVDLSRPGVFTAPFHQTCQVSHGEAFFLDVQEWPAGERDATELLRGLAGTITVSDNEGNSIRSLKIPPETNTSITDDGSIAIACTVPFRNGDYTVTVDVQTGAPALAGFKQTIHARYLICGCERFPVTVALCLAIVCGVVGLVVGAKVITGFVRYGWSRADTCA